MIRRIVLMLLCVSLMLSGCHWPDGSYVSVTPHQEQRQDTQTEVISASDYQELMAALENLVSEGTETAAINVADYPAGAVKSGMAVAMRYVMENDSIGAYAVEEITYEPGSSGGQPALAVSIRYRHTRAEIQRIRRLQTMEEAEAAVAEALKNYEAGVVMMVEDYSTRDFTQVVEDLAEENPQVIMETPQVAVGIYGTGKERVIELNFVYQTGRSSLRQMQAQVKPVFEAASLYVSGDGSDWQKYAQLYAFLTERFDYKLETSITPSYSLLCHGVGDSRAFATVYAAMCRAAGLECSIVTGTCSGEPRVWNIICDNGYYYHVDLLRSSEQGRFREWTDNQMYGYVWDYSAYPACVGVPVAEPEETQAASAPAVVPESTDAVQATDASPAETEAEMGIQETGSEEQK